MPRIDTLAGEPSCSNRPVDYTYYNHIESHARC